MEKYNENIDIQYCTECGAVNKKSATVCSECEKKIKGRHFPFSDFLIGHIKSDIKDGVSTSVFSLFKKAIISHLYGTVLTVSIIATATVSALTATPYIKPTKSQPPTDVINEIPPEEEQIASFTIGEDEIDSVKYLTTSYDALADSRRSGDAFYEPESGPASKFWAEGNIPGYTFSGAHPLYSSPVSISADLDDFSSVHEARMSIDSTLTNQNITTELGKQLKDAGYDVMECDYYMGVFDHSVEGDLNSLSTWQSENPARLCVYRFVFVRNEDSDWYIADEVLTQRKGV